MYMLVEMIAKKIGRKYSELTIETAQFDRKNFAYD